MLNEFRESMGRGKDCPSLDELARLIDNPQGPLQRHVEQCPHCRTELSLLQPFLAGDVDAADETAVDQITARLGSTRAAVPEIRERRRWLDVFWARWFRPAGLAFAAALLLAGVGLQLRRADAPALTPISTAPETMRSTAVTITAPVGDLEAAPKEIHWQPVAGAAKYEVRVLEVDGTEVWRGETEQAQIELPASVQARIVPAKTLLSAVRAVDAEGRTVAESDSTRFRLLQKIH